MATPWWMHNVLMWWFHLPRLYRVTVVAQCIQIGGGGRLKSANMTNLINMCMWTSRRQRTPKPKLITYKAYRSLCKRVFISIKSSREPHAFNFQVDICCRLCIEGKSLVIAFRVFSFKWSSLKWNVILTLSRPNAMVNTINGEPTSITLNN